MSKRVLIVSASLRAHSNSHALAERFAQGARETGHSVEIVSLQNKTIAFCRGCLACQKTGSCVIRDDAVELAQKMHISYDPYQFFAESHPKLKPVETNTAGIYLAGACQAPKDIPETVGMASGDAVKVAGLFSQANLVREPLIAVVNRTAPPLFSTCVGCFMCQTACPYQAIEREEIKDRNGNVIKTVAKVNPGLCQGCGTCVAFCRSKSIDIQGYSNEQVYAEVMALLNY